MVMFDYSGLCNRILSWVNDDNGYNDSNNSMWYIDVGTPIIWYLSKRKHSVQDYIGWFLGIRITGSRFG